LILLASTPSGSIAETPINSVYLLGMVCIRALICSLNPKSFNYYAVHPLGGLGIEEREHAWSLKMHDLSVQQSRHFLLLRGDSIEAVVQ
jgi:hypothetical protein